MQQKDIRFLLPQITDNELIEDIHQSAIEKHYQPNDNIMRRGQYMGYLPIVISGNIKVMREDDQGNEMLLYFLEKGDSCAMSISCCLHQKKSNIRATAEEKTSLLLIPIEKNNEWLQKHNSWRNFIITSYSSRMDKLLFALDSIAFSNLDERLLNYLQERVKITKNNTLSITHNDISIELNSSREVISRLLKKLETLDKVQLGRNKITLL